MYICIYTIKGYKLLTQIVFLIAQSQLKLEIKLRQQLPQVKKLSKMAKYKWQIKENCIKLVHIKVFVLIMFSKTCFMHAGKSMLQFLLFFTDLI